MKTTASRNGQPPISFEEINERWRKAHSVQRVRKTRKRKDDTEPSAQSDKVEGGIPVWSEAKSLRQDYRCKCRDTIKQEAWHALNLETGQRLCMACAVDLGLPRSLFWHYWRQK